MHALRDAGWGLPGPVGLQFFLNVVDLGMNVQEAAGKANCNSEHLHGSCYPRQAYPGRVTMESRIGQDVRNCLAAMGHTVRVDGAWSGCPVTGFAVDPETGVMAVGVSPRGEKAYAAGREESECSPCLG